jgi:histidine triad (HIT) family protein
MSNCIFCMIATGEIPSTKLYEDEQILAFHDLNPQAPIHFLVIPKAHIASMDDVTAENAAIIGHIFATIPALMAKQGAASGYRVVSNCGADGGQTVGHLHFHCLAGRELAWPPG